VLPFVDFNQGLEAARFTSHHANRIAEIKAVKIRFALDSWEDQGDVYRAIEICRRYNLNDIGIYVLIGFDDTPAEAKEKLEWVRSLNIRPNPMRFQPLRCKAKNSYVAKGWTEKELKDMARYYSKLRYLEHIPFEDYEGCEETQKDLLWPIPVTPDGGR